MYVSVRMCVEINENKIEHMCVGLRAELLWKPMEKFPMEKFP